ncbi:MAG: phage/plasmid primase, P4 family [Syntrophorhabdaceae bacterium]|nr:phage/plasmid primase, P4 family [Syntrophorhabdaceae bacterium]
MARVNYQTAFEEQIRDADGQTENQQFTAQRAENLESEFILQALNRNADGDASLFIELHRGRFVYDYAADRWFKWGGHYWLEDLTDQVLQKVGDVVDIYEAEAKRQAWLRAKAAREKDGTAERTHRDTETALFKRIKALQSLKRKQEILVLARSGDNTLACTGDEWDKDPWVLAASNGVIDLKTGELRPGRPSDFIKTAAPTEWHGVGEPCPVWEKFMLDIFRGDEELFAFLQRLLGYGITGLSVHHIFVILHGVGRNGKGTMLETLRHVLGDYAMKTESELLLEQNYARQAGSPNSAVLSLRGKRLVWASETSDGRKLDAGRIKELVGGDTLNARPVFGKHHVQFKPSHLLLLMTNSKPSAPASDYALWKRIYLIPFNQSFVDNPQTMNESKADPYLSDKLKAEAPGILAWLVRGCIVWQCVDINPPQIVRLATEEYQKDEDIIGKFLDEKTVQNKNCTTKAGELYKNYKEWCEDNGIYPLNSKRFGTEMKRRYDWQRDRSGIHYIGIEVLV